MDPRPAAYISFPKSEWNPDWELTTDLTPATWVQRVTGSEWENFLSGQRESRSPASVVTGRVWDKYLVLPYASIDHDKSSRNFSEYLTDEISAAFATVFGRHSSDPDTCWATVWDGFGDLEDRIVSFPQKVSLVGGLHEYLSLIHI